MKVRLNALETIVLFFQAEDGIRDWSVTGVQTVLFRSLFWPPDGPYTDTQSLYCGEGSYSLKACICRGHSGSRNPQGRLVEGPSESALASRCVRFLITLSRLLTQWCLGSYEISSFLQIQLFIPIGQGTRPKITW